MATLGAVVLGIIGTIVMNYLLALIGALLFPIMASSTGPLIPILMGTAFGGCAVYGGVYFALAIVPKASTTIAFYTIVGLLVCSGIVSLLKLESSGTIFDVLWLGLRLVSYFVGGYIAKVAVDSERADGQAV